MPELSPCRRNWVMERMAVPTLRLIVVLGILASMLALPIFGLLSDDVRVDFTVLRNKVGPGEWARYELTIENRGIAYDVFNIVNDLEGVEWSMLTEPQSRAGIIIKGGSQEKIKILLKDLNLTRDWRRPQFVSIFVENKDRTVRKTIKLPVYLIPGPVVEGVYFDVTPTFPDRIDPRKTHSFKLTIKNNNWQEYQDVRVAVKSTDFERESLVNFGPNETKSVEFTVTFDPMLQPKTETIAVTLSSGGIVYHIDEQQYDVVAYNTPFETTSTKETSFLKVTETITAKNGDNVEETQDVVRPASWFKRLLGSTSPPAEVRDVDGTKAYVWSLTLPPGGAATLAITTNYRLILYTVLLLAVIIFLWHMFQSPVVVVKRAEFVKTQEGAISEIDLRLDVENRSNADLRNVKLIEHIPNLMKIVWKSKHTFHPKKVTAVANGHVMQWEFDLTPKEERILSYTLVPRLSVLGELRLAPATLKYVYDNHELKATSNEVYVTNVRMDGKADGQS